MTSGFGIIIENETNRTDHKKFGAHACTMGWICQSTNSMDPCARKVDLKSRKQMRNNVNNKRADAWLHMHG